VIPIARIRLTVPTSTHEAGTVLEATAIIKAGGFTFYEVGSQLITNGLEAELIEELK
jgi:hypothetical protein